MEKKAEQKEKESIIWDCGSSLYDSFELKSFENKLNSAISSRTLSMPHLSDRRPPFNAAGPPPPSQKIPSKKSSLSIFHKLLRSVFKPRQKNYNPSSGQLFQVQERYRDGFYVRGCEYDGSISMRLSAIPEVPEADGFSPLVRRTASDRFTAVSMNISCA